MITAAVVLAVALSPVASAALAKGHSSFSTSTSSTAVVTAAPALLARGIDVENKHSSSVFVPIRTSIEPFDKMSDADHTTYSGMHLTTLLTGVEGDLPYETTWASPDPNENPTVLGTEPYTRRVATWTETWTSSHGRSSTLSEEWRSKTAWTAPIVPPTATPATKAPTSHKKPSSAAYKPSNKASNKPAASGKPAPKPPAKESHKTSHKRRGHRKPTPGGHDQPKQGHKEPTLTQPTPTPYIHTPPGGFPTAYVTTITLPNSYWHPGSPIPPGFTQPPPKSDPNYEWISDWNESDQWYKGGQKRAVKTSTEEFEESPVPTDVPGWNDDEDKYYKGYKRGAPENVEAPAPTHKPRFVTEIHTVTVVPHSYSASAVLYYSGELVKGGQEAMKTNTFAFPSSDDMDPVLPATTGPHTRYTEIHKQTGVPDKFSLSAAFYYSELAKRETLKTEAPANAQPAPTSTHERSEMLNCCEWFGSDYVIDGKHCVWCHKLPQFKSKALALPPPPPAPTPDAQVEQSEMPNCCEWFGSDYVIDGKHCVWCHKLSQFKSKAVALPPPPPAPTSEPKEMPNCCEWYGGDYVIDGKHCVWCHKLPQFKTKEVVAPPPTPAPTPDAEVEQFEMPNCCEWWGGDYVIDGKHCVWCHKLPQFKTKEVAPPPPPAPTPDALYEESGMPNCCEWYGDNYIIDGKPCVWCHKISGFKTKALEEKPSPKPAPPPPPPAAAAPTPAPEMPNCCEWWGGDYVIDGKHCVWCHKLSQFKTKEFSIGKRSTHSAPKQYTSAVYEMHTVNPPNLKDCDGPRAWNVDCYHPKSKRGEAAHLKKSKYTTVHYETTSGAWANYETELHTATQLPHDYTLDWEVLEKKHETGKKTSAFPTLTDTFPKISATASPKHKSSSTVDDWPIDLAVKHKTNSVKGAATSTTSPPEITEPAQIDPRNEEGDKPKPKDDKPKPKSKKPNSPKHTSPSLQSSWPKVKSWGISEANALTSAVVWITRRAKNGLPTSSVYTAIPPTVTSSAISSYSKPCRALNSHAEPTAFNEIGVALEEESMLEGRNEQNGEWVTITKSWALSSSLQALKTAHPRLSSILELDDGDDEVMVERDMNNAQKSPKTIFTNKAGITTGTATLSLTDGFGEMPTDVYKWNAPKNTLSKPTGKPTADREDGYGEMPTDVLKRNEAKKAPDLSTITFSTAIATATVTVTHPTTTQTAVSGFDVKEVVPNMEMVGNKAVVRKRDQNAGGKVGVGMSFVIGVVFLVAVLVL